MSWYSSPYRQRRLCCFVNVGGGGTKDINYVIPADDDEFWGANPSDTTMLEIRVTSGDGYTLLAYSVDDGSSGTASRSARTARIRIDGMAVPGTTNELVAFYVYFDTSSTQGTGAVATTITSAETAYCERGTPTDWVAPAIPPEAGDDTPRSKFGKDPSDQRDLWFDLTDVLQRRLGPYANRRDYEGPRSAIYEVDNSSAAAQSAMIDLTLSRFVEVVEGNRRRTYLRVRVKAGSDSTDYTAIATILTALPLQSGTHRTLIARAAFRVRAVLES